MKTIIAIFLTMLLFQPTNAIDYKDPEKIIPGLLTGAEMSPEKLGEIVQTQGKVLDSNKDYWYIEYSDRMMLIIIDAETNRLRIMAGITPQKDLTEDHYTAILNAQFANTLDVKYALFNEVLWSIYMHPLKEVSESQIKDAMRQVYNAANNFGSTYSSF